MAPNSFLGPFSAFRPLIILSSRWRSKQRAATCNLQEAFCTLTAEASGRKKPTMMPPTELLWRAEDGAVFSRKRRPSKIGRKWDNNTPYEGGDGCQSFLRMRSSIAW
ncbi:hypothetical protein ACHAXS_001924 [Conticribra weissflogii]